MKGKFQTLRGFRDVIGEEADRFFHLEKTARDVFRLSNCMEIRIPVVEKAELFIKSIGESTDIVEKEMYIFEDKNGELVALRPEGTASVVRAYIEKGMYVSSPKAKLFYTGPMFRRERPQKGRFRQFYQIGIEYFGVKEPSADAEVISILFDIYRKVGIESVRLRMNTLGCRLCRVEYIPRLKAFLDKHSDEICEDCRRRKELNPLRFFDCKNENDELKYLAPLVEDELCEECKEHYTLLKGYLKSYPVEHDPHLVRGLDYYTRTVFELYSEEMGKDFALSAGGRYDDLVESFGGPSTPAVGFAIGCERTVQLIESTKHRVDVFLIVVRTNYTSIALDVLMQLRATGLICDFDASGGSVKAQMRKANRLNSRYVLFLGDEEVGERKFRVKNMDTGEETIVPWGEISRFKNTRFNK